MNVLVLTTEPVGADALRGAIGDSLDPNNTQVMVLAPAVHENPLKFWMSDADDAIARADEVRAKTVERLGDGGISATADQGESEPMQAVEDALATFPADRSVMFARSDERQGYREELDPREVERRFGIPAVMCVA